MDESAIETLKTWKFAPAKRIGVPAPVRALVVIRFQLNSSTP
ncbi:MAG: energy transducer TonB [Terriglobia bacterium]